jgi:hypothetical protein
VASKLRWSTSISTGPRGSEHLVGGEHGVVDVTAPDLLLEDGDEIVHRNAMG